MERLQKFIATCGIASRRAAEKYITDGRISVNGETVTEQGIKIDPEKDVVAVDGKIIKETVQKVYIILYKPKGYISTVKDEKDRRTVMDLVADIPQRIFPVGRLDNNTEGLLLMTNDGDLTQKLLHPKFKITKTYMVTIKDIMDNDSLGRLRRGVNLEDGKTAPAEAKIVSYDRDTNHSRVEITIHEGRNRQVRRMFQAVGYDVAALKRTRFAGLTLQGLKRGKYRNLEQEELKQLINTITEK